MLDLQPIAAQIKTFARRSVNPKISVLAIITIFLVTAIVNIGAGALVFFTYGRTGRMN